MSFAWYWGGIAFFSVVFFVFLAVAYSVVLGIIENYFRYYQRADQQWTGRESRFKALPVRIGWLVVISVLCAWIVVHFVVQP